MTVPSAYLVRSPGLAPGVVRALALVLSCAGTLACVDSTGPPHPLLEETEFAAALDIDLEEMTRIGGGVYVKDTMAGTGTKVDISHRIVVSYELFVPDGRSVYQREDARFVTGCRHMVPGLEIGIRGMRAGGTRRIVVPPRVGFGERPPWRIDVPPHSILVYTVELHSSALTTSETACMHP